VKQEDLVWKFLSTNQSSFMFGVGTAFPAAVFRQKFSLARNQMIFCRPTFCCL